jgi:apolipoprotein D and lipocalin family protein
VTQPAKSKIRRASALLVTAAVIALLNACAVLDKGPVGNAAVPQPAKAVELDRYLGRWYEYGRYEASFQKDCEAVTADYARADKGTISVLNSCRKGGVSGKASTAKGKANVVEGSNGAKLKVSFFGPFYGDYWVLDRADDYSWAIVGEPSGRYLWMLTRQAKPAPADAALLQSRVKELGYNWSLVRITAH